MAQTVIQTGQGIPLLKSPELKGIGSEALVPTPPPSAVDPHQEGKGAVSFRGEIKIQTLGGRSVGVSEVEPPAALR
jgi:hypothetical protein